MVNDHYIQANTGCIALLLQHLQFCIHTIQHYTIYTPYSTIPYTYHCIIKLSIIYLKGVAEDVMATAVISGTAGDGCSRFSLPSSAGTVCAEIGETVTISCNGGFGYTITGPNAQFAMDQDLVVAGIANGDGGSYTCSNGEPCFNMSVVNIIVSGQ